MKKTYIIPEFHIARITTERLMATSQFDVDASKDADQQYVKGNPASRSDYNVWDEDWSK